MYEPIAKEGDVIGAFEGNLLCCDSCPAKVAVFHAAFEAPMIPEGWGALLVSGDKESGKGFGDGYHLCPDCLKKLGLNNEEN